ncbi:hypothetical protein M1D72_13740 [Vibrio sp. AK197]|uniref:Uncharacterized protein n=1 Tax=Vibrio olivae TaxID=1243002 RepID=A0ABV5HJC9_9VIBR
MLDDVLLTLSWMLLGMLFIYPFAVAVLQGLSYSKHQVRQRKRVKYFNFIFLLLFVVISILYLDGAMIGYGSTNYYAWLTTP